MSKVSRFFVQKREREREHSTSVSGFECVILEAERGREIQNMTLYRERLEARKTKTYAHVHHLWGGLSFCEGDHSSELGNLS